MRKFLALIGKKCKAVLALLAISPVFGYCDPHMVRARSEVPTVEQWNLNPLYQSWDSWRQELTSYLNGFGLESYRGRLREGPAVVGELLRQYFTIDRSLTKLYTYAHLRHDEDVGHDASKEAYGRVTTLQHNFALAASWIEPELLALSDADYQQLYRHPATAEFKIYLEKVGRMRAHTLPPEQEALLALMGQALGAPSRAFGALNNADLTFEPALDSTGAKRELTTGTFQLYLKDGDRTLRKNAFLNIHRAFQAHENALCELIRGEVEGQWALARARRYDSCLEAALFPHQIDLSVYHNLLAAVEKRLPSLHRYIAFRKQKMGLDEIHPYDLYVPLVDSVPFKFTYAEACEAVAASVAPLGPDYQAIVHRGLFEEGWVDPFENQRKRSGAYSSGCYDSHPYILLNFQGTLNDTLTLAHEAGHSLHTYFSHKTQPYWTSHYPIFVAEVASTFNEQLLLQHLTQKAQSKAERAYLVQMQLEGIRATIIRQTLFAAFELQLHQWVEEGVPLTPKLLKEAYRDLNRKFFGPDLVLDEELDIEWARIPHFYYNFYVYQYATGLSAALALHSQKPYDKYLRFLTLGGSRYPLDLLIDAGCDLRTPQPVEAAFDRFDQLLAELERLLS